MTIQSMARSGMRALVMMMAAAFLFVGPAAAQQAEAEAPAADEAPASDSFFFVFSSAEPEPPPNAERATAGSSLFTPVPTGANGPPRKRLSARDGCGLCGLRRTCDQSPHALNVPAIPFSSVLIAILGRFEDFRYAAEGRVVHQESEARPIAAAITDVRVAIQA